MRSASTMRFLFIMVAAAFMAACASMGRPEGGPRDEDPPVFVRSNPMPGQVNVKGTRITVDFDENIALEDAMNKIVVSPAQRTTPMFTSNGRRVTVELRDTLLPNTTYTIDFADAVKDLNESNILDGLAIDFATGDSIDTLRISGMVFDARTLEPAQGMLVGVYSNLSDTAITTLPFERITKTARSVHRAQPQARSLPNLCSQRQQPRLPLGPLGGCGFLRCHSHTFVPTHHRD